MDRREQKTFLSDFFLSQEKEIPSDAELEKLMTMTYENGDAVIDFENQSVRIEVLAVLKELPLSEAVLYFSQSKNFDDMVLNSALMANAKQEIKTKRDILSRDPPGAKDVFGKCPHCGNTKLKKSEAQTRSADEGITVKLVCTRCFRSWIG